MPRPRAFDADTVRERVADAFTAHGYRGTSLALLEEAAGLGKQSLYNAFGDKRALYLEALDCSARRMAGAQTAMARAPNGRAAVAAFFADVTQMCTDDRPEVHACIVTHGLLEGVEEPEVRDALRRKWQATEAMLQAAVRRGQRDGSIRTDVPATGLAAALMTLMGGLRVSARAETASAKVAATADLMLHVLDPPG